MASDGPIIREISSEEKMVIHMRIAAHQRLSMLMRPRSFMKDWKNLADLMGFTWEEILNIQECDFDPVISVVRQWERNPDATIKKLISFLKKLGRHDVVEDLQPFIDETPFPSEYERRALEKRQKRPVERRLSLELEILTVSDEIYDGFICYAKEDREFASQILQKLEGPPYNLKICIDYRDYVPGNCKLNQMAQIIEDRCQRIVTILSPNFNDSQDAGYQVKIALNLSPDARDRRVIPVIFCDCKVPRILQHITHLDYRDELTRPYFWVRLAASLGCRLRSAGPQSPAICEEKTQTPVAE